jgi:nitronate monooxygenase
MLKTILSELVGARYPIINAPMTPAAGGQLARAVTDAGGFGMIGVESKDSLDYVQEQLELVREYNPLRKFGIGLTAWGIAGRPELLEFAIKANPTAICLSFGDIAPYAKNIREKNILLLTQVQDLQTAMKAQAAGANILICQGTEAGGHTGSVGTLPLLQIILNKVSCPVVAAGGIGSGRGLAAVLAAGAVGAWVGTPFLLAKEAKISDRTRERIIKATETETIHTHLFDHLQNLSWPEQFPGRALKNLLTEKWHGKEREAAANPAVLAEFQEAKISERFDLAHIYAGQIVGLLETCTTAEGIVKSIAADAEIILRKQLTELRLNEN